MGFKVHVGDKTYEINVPKWLGGSKEDLQTSAPVSVGHGVAAKREHKNQLDEINRELNNVGRSKVEQEVFDNDYTD